MRCRHCGKEVPLRMRWAGETGFCCPEHKRNFQEEHSQLGLQRLLEEVGPQKEAVPTPAAPVSAAPPEPLQPQAVLPDEAPQVWRFPPFSYTLAPRIADSLRLSFDPLPYRPGSDRTVRVAEPEEPADSTPASAGEESAPQFEFRSFSDRPASSAGGRLRWLVAMSAVGVLAAALGLAACLGWFRQAAAPTTQPAAATADIAAAESPAAPASVDQEWLPNWATKGPADDIALFRPSEQWSDYLVESVAAPGQSVAWVYRAVDPGNYYALRLEYATNGELRLIRYAVIDGQQTLPEEAAIPAPPGNLNPGVRLEVRGAAFTLFLDGNRVAAWSDTRLARGGFGVIGRNMDLARTKAVKVTRLAADSAYRSRPPVWLTLSPQLASITITPMEEAPKRASGETN